MIDMGLSATWYLPFLMVPTVFITLLMWELIWKGFALWHSAKNGQKYWFIAILIINSFALVPLIYLVFFRNKTFVKKSKKRKKK